MLGNFIMSVIFAIIAKACGATEPLIMFALSMIFCRVHDVYELIKKDR